MVGRTGFKGDLLYSVGVSGFIYPILGHWVWGPGGWLATMGTPFRDFAGSTVVHTVGGMVALTGAIALGPRLGRKFKRDGGGMWPGHDMTIAAVGGVILWFGWYGFNPGSTLSAMDFEGIGRVATNTTLAACAGGLVAMFFVYPSIKKWDVGITVNGFLGGLVAITCPCYWVDPFGAIIIGAIAGVVVVLGVDFIEWLRIDDPDRCRRRPRHLRHLGHAQPRAVRRRQVRPAGDRPTGTSARRLDRHGRGPLLRWWHRPAGRPDHRQRGDHGGHPGRRLRPDVRWSSSPGPCGSPRRASSRASTSTSTAPRLPHGVRHGRGRCRSRPRPGRRDRRRRRSWSADGCPPTTFATRGGPPAPPRATRRAPSKRKGNE